MLNRIFTELSVLCIITCVLESALIMATHSFGRAVHLHITLGISKGLGVFMVVLITLVQVISCVVLMTPKIYFKTGTIFPSLTLSVSIWCELLIFEDLTDQLTFLYGMLSSAALVAIAMFRYDRRARNLALQTPTSSVFHVVDKYIKQACTFLRCVFYAPVLSVLLVTWGMFVNRFWLRHGIAYELARIRWRLALTMASLFFIQAAQDAATKNIKIWKLRAKFEKIIQYLYPNYAGEILGLGLKKRL